MLLDGTNHQYSRHLINKYAEVILSIVLILLIV